MSRIAIMQPYVFPYIGYFQMISAVDTFVFYNDVNFINRGWINRNRILVNGREYMFTIPLQKVSQNKLICETNIDSSSPSIKKVLVTIENAYKKAPYFNDAMPLLETVFQSKMDTIDSLAEKSIRVFLDYFDIKARLISSLNRYDNIHFKNSDRLIDICHRENCLSYINAIGGKDIYTKEYFAGRGISLSFIKSRPIRYKQFKDNFVDGLSIIDMAMFCSKDTVKEFLNQFDLL